MLKITYPLDVPFLLRNRKPLARELAGGMQLLEVRIAVLGGVTTSELVADLELLLLNAGIRAHFYESEYNKFFEEAVLNTAALIAFRPDIVYLFTSSKNIRTFPPVLASHDMIEDCARGELEPFEQVWTAIQNSISNCTVLQNNFEPSASRPLGNLEGAAAYGKTAFIDRLNSVLATRARNDPRLKLVDAHGLATHLGILRWFSPTYWFSFKMAQTPEAAMYLANAAASLIASLYGRSRKCLVLDLDNTLWGGVIGDDGVNRIQLGHETALAEAYTEFQCYCKALRERGVLLAVCSKNDRSTALQGFDHPDSVLKVSDFSSFQASWNPKTEGIEAIAQELNIGLESIVFLDDNPAERALVQAELPMVAVPEVGDDVSRYPEILEESGYFEASAFSIEDLGRAQLYAENAARREISRAYNDYGAYLASLTMEADIREFSSVYLDRIAQLTNKTNQFNLTTKRFTRAELEHFSARSDCVALYGRLRDRFGDNGLVSVVLGFVDNRVLDIDLWLMSCRVLKREMELAMLDHVVATAQRLGVAKLVGRYVRTDKNGMVARFYEELGFTLLYRSDDGSMSKWELAIDGGRYTPRNRYIKDLYHDLAGHSAALAADFS